MYNIDGPNIITIHNDIITKFQQREKDLPNYKHELAQVDKLLLRLGTLSKKIEQDLQVKKNYLLSLISDIENKINYNFYIMEASPLVEDYKNIISKPVKISFMGKEMEKNSIKDEKVKQYLSIVEKYNSILQFSLEIKKESSPVNKIPEDKKICSSCNQLDYELTDGLLICKHCGMQKEVNNLNSCYKDVDRVNITRKYKYDKRIHFRDCIHQFQGTQNTMIDPSVYTDITDWFELHGLLLGDKNTDKKIRFSKIEREHIHMALKETNNNKYYEDEILILYNLTDKPPYDISQYEDRLMLDYDQIVLQYDTKYKLILNKKNLINTQSILYRLLKKYGFSCRKRDFNILKTVERQDLAEETLDMIFSDLGWNCSI